MHMTVFVYISYLKGKMQERSLICHWTRSYHNVPWWRGDMVWLTDYGRPIKPVFIEIQNFWQGQTNWPDKFWGIWGYFRPNYQHPFWYSSVFSIRDHPFKTSACSSPIRTGVFLGQSWTGGGANLAPPCYLSPGASEKLVLNMTFVTIFLRIILRCITFL